MRYQLIKEKFGKQINFCVKDRLTNRIIYRSSNGVQVQVLIDDLNRRKPKVM